MMTRHRSRFTMMLVAAVALGTASAAHAQTGPAFEVTVTNLTAHQVFTPILVASHRAGVTLFTAGHPASQELEILAEGGDTSALGALLGGMADVRDVSTGAALPPGQTQTIRVATGAGFDHVSLAAMLVPTNDAFVAVNGVAGPPGSHVVTLYPAAYDAGTEANDENCAIGSGTIPGPPGVCQGEGFNPSQAGAEGFVHVHRGIQGVSTLDPATYDWRNPVARVTIRRVPQLP